MHNESKIKPLKDAFGELFSRLQLVNANLLDKKSINKAIEGADYVVHTASPFTFSSESEEALVKPAVDGTLGVMVACHEHKVKRVVITSSIAAIMVGWKKTDKRPKAWNEEHWSKEENMNSRATWYLKSKTLAEKAAWRSQKSADTEVVTICPGFIIGPAFCGAGFESGNTVLNIMEDKMPYIPAMPTVDVRDVSLAHLNAIKIPEVAN